jgi:benzoyl-CoA reductase/2-hydroxyglutaryl-CoA dehydratase subunit BcrC/BadD/HgdB
VRSDDEKEKYIREMLDFFKVDGIIYHDCWTCSFATENRYGQPDRIQEEKGIKSIVVNGDVADIRLFSKEQTFTQLEAFVEELEEDK